MKDSLSGRSVSHTQDAQPTPPKKSEYLNHRMQAISLTKKDITISGRDESGKSRRYQLLTSSKDGGILFHYFDIDGNPKTFIRNKKEIYLQNERLHPEQVKEGRKCKFPNGAKTDLFNTKTTINPKKRYSTLYIVEGELKAIAGSKYGLYISAIPGIHNIKGEDKKLHHDISRLIEKGEVKNVVFLLDADLHDIKYKDEETNVAKRPNSFFSAAWNFREKLKSFDVDVYLAHPKKENENSPKGLDDLLAANKGREKEIIKDLDSFTDQDPKFFEIKIIEDKQKLKRVFGLTSAKEFYEKHKKELQLHPFKFWHKKYVFDGKKVVLIEGQATKVAQKAASVVQWFKQKEISIRFNLISRLYEMGEGNFEDKDFNTLYLKIHQDGIDITKDLFRSIIESDLSPAYNPLIKFFEDNSHIKETGKIKELAESVEQATYSRELWETLLKKWMVGAVAGLDPKHRNLLELVFLGKMATGKSTFFEKLLPEELQPYSVINKLDGEKDADILICQRFLICDEEYGGRSKKDAKRHKELLSKRTVTVRLPYGRHAIKMDRIATMCGTTNEREILTDITGNRRVIPVEVISRDWEKYDNIDKTELWVEAYHLFKEGFNYELTEKEMSALTQNTTDFKRSSPEADNIVYYLGKPEDYPEEEVSYMNNAQIIDYLEATSETKHRLNTNKLGGELYAMGFEKKSIRIGKSSPRNLWQVVKLDKAGSREIKIVAPLKQVAGVWTNKEN